MNRNKLKIAFLHRANDPYTLERIKYFIKNNHEVFSIMFDLGETVSEPDGLITIKLRKTILDKIPFVKRVIHYFEIKRILKQINPDVLHVVNALNLFYLYYKCKCLKVIENQGTDVILTPKRFKFLIPFYRFMYKKVDAVVQDSEVAYKSVLKYGAPENNHMNKIIEIGIDFNIFNKNVTKDIIRKTYNLSNRKIVFCSRGVVNPIYNIDTIIKSILTVRKNFPGCIYILTAEKDQLNSQLSGFIRKHNLEKNILFAGHQNRIKNLKYFYRDADVNISVPSSDSSPFSVYESMACLTPNVVTDLPWLYSKFIPGKHLLVCPARDEEALAEKINTALNGNHNLDLLSAYDIVYEKINLMRENERLESLYRTILHYRTEKVIENKLLFNT